MLQPVVERSQLAEARRRALVEGRRRGLDGEACERLGLVVTEIASNLLRHTPGGHVLLLPTQDSQVAGIHAVGLDDGPGIASVEQALEDGFSTAADGSLGGGLGTLRRQSERFDLYSDPSGTTVVATVAPGWQGAVAPGAQGSLDVEGLTVPKPGFDVGGDAWATRAVDGATWAMLIDVLGHGAKAAASAEIALAAFHQSGAGNLQALERELSEALTRRRGAAILVLEHRPGEAEITALGVGNVRGEIVSTRERKHILSAAGVLGETARAPQPTRYDWPDRAVLVMFTDGARDSIRAVEPIQLYARDPLTIAATIYARRRRGTDDCGVVVARAAKQDGDESRDQ